MIVYADGSCPHCGKNHQVALDLDDVPGVQWIPDNWFESLDNVIKSLPPKYLPPLQSLMRMFPEQGSANN